MNNCFPILKESITIKTRWLDNDPVAIKYIRNKGAFKFFFYIYHLFGGQVFLFKPKNLFYFAKVTNFPNFWYFLKYLVNYTHINTQYTYVHNNIVRCGLLMLSLQCNGNAGWSFINVSACVNNTEAKIGQKHNNFYLERWFHKCKLMGPPKTLFLFIRQKY